MVPDSGGAFQPGVRGLETGGTGSIGKTESHAHHTPLQLEVHSFFSSLGNPIQTSPSEWCDLVEQGTTQLSFT